ncbi:Glucitol operon repressor [Actinomadura rubteroloni]|uniref:Lactose phosphotransferase system repressor n=1 Tax=Actinomadura rubteroloni TaxID=1926885 RepID=A0A2P4UFJ0_9ACTN|nr:DeoR/GlpR family DNA-binding transcription regulator [Actinomadura rubteroloni]POM23823.1 Glucitol operon repressor [Actinomadura rubteroloni]
MNVRERHRLVVAILAERNRATVAELAKAAGTSEMTVRRDLEHLEAQGALRRVHGGAVSALLSGVEQPFALRALVGADAKARLAAAVTDLLKDGETVALDTGTTAVAVATAMAARRLTVTPLSLHAVHPLEGADGVRLLLPGGQVRPGELSFHGDLAVRTFADLRYDTFVLSCCGIDASVGATAHDLDDVHVKRAAIRAAQRTVLVATAEKLGRVAFGRVCGPQDLSVVITDARSDNQIVQDLRAAGVTVTTV